MAERTDPSWTTLGGIHIESIYGMEKAGAPPYTRGIHENMYRSRHWTMRQYAGFSSAEETNNRFKLLLEKGQTGLSVAFDLPTQLGLDADDPLAEGEVGKVGVSISTVDDMHRLFSEIPLESISTSMTINAPAMVLLAMYLVVAEEKGMSRENLRGTIQNDILKEYIARGTYIFPPSPSMRLITDCFAFCANQMPLWNPISISGYHIREAGSTAIQEVAITLANGLEYIEEAVKKGLDIDQFAPRLSFFFNCHNDFFEEIAKFRAARKLWHDLVSQRYHPKNPKSLKLRFHTQVAGVSLTAQQPLNNISRVTIQALAAVCGGTQSLHTNSYDEAIGLPTEESATVALRTQQIIAEESGAASVVDPLGGSYYVEHLTSEIYDKALAKIKEIDELGGALSATIAAWPQKEIHEAAWNHLNDVESGRRKIIGVNHGTQAENMHYNVQKIDESLSNKQKIRLEDVKNNRSSEDVSSCLEKIRLACENNDDLFELVINAVKHRCTLGEIISTMKEVFGTYMAPTGF